MKRVLVSLASAMIVPIGFWLAGWDFNERGGQALFCYVFTVLIAGIIYSYPGWDEK